MSKRSILLLRLLIIFSLSFTVTSSESYSLYIRQNGDGLTCVSIGECEPCTDLERKTEDYCSIYGNKEPIQCFFDSGKSDQNTTLPTYRACPKVRRVERLKFYEFQVINIVVALLATSVMVWRQRKLIRDQERRRARRINV
ncbi:uncharacterized protein VTP21DRAFT_2776 [Calcarisporiella thermophila]|uniref:uncharacterized protein n=1 Tax=Calcarisporiella thermophila TaxID=911321 RepID=UPI0037449AB3